MKKYGHFFGWFLLLSVAFLLRFYNLNWGAPFFFHPDERNIASAVSQLRFPAQLNPHFFAYGSLPLYFIYASAVLSNVLTFCFFTNQGCIVVTFENALLLSRIISAVFSFLLIPLIYFLGKKIAGKAVGIFAAILAVFSTGLIQYAHFGTFEMWLSFFYTLLLYLCLQYYQTPSLKRIVLLSLTSGLLMGIKISSLALLVLPLGVILLTFWFQKKKIIRHMGIFLLLTFLTFLMTNPFTFIAFPSFLGSMRYESAVALGTLPVFYTGQFIGTLPVFYQFFFVYPFILNPVLTVLFLPSFFLTFLIASKTKKISYLLLLLFFLIFFLSQAFLFVKWTRYLIPTLPMIYLILSIGIKSILEKLFKENSFRAKTSFSILSLISLIFGVSYFMTAFIESDTRIKAAQWSKQYLKPSTNIISENYDLGVMPFQQQVTQIELFNFYNLDSKQGTKKDLSQTLNQANYLLLPSQRIFRSRLLNAGVFPQGNKFYTNLLKEQKNFKIIYQTPCSVFCCITYLNDPVFRFEETTSVFDRPTVIILKKIK